EAPERGGPVLVLGFTPPPPPPPPPPEQVLRERDQVDIVRAIGGG
ncbi:hypothetical protein ACFDR9_002363, partial [Janthinobacterium sp. CG_23.3]